MGGFLLCLSLPLHCTYDPSDVASLDLSGYPHVLFDALEELLLGAFALPLLLVELLYPLQLVLLLLHIELHLIVPHLLESLRGLAV
jgi:hypothetical protein